MIRTICYAIGFPDGSNAIEEENSGARLHETWENHQRSDRRYQAEYKGPNGKRKCIACNTEAKILPDVHVRRFVFAWYLKVKLAPCI